MTAVTEDRRGARPRALGVLTMLIGLGLLPGAVALMSNGGSLYYLAAALALIAAGWWVFKGDARGAWLYLAFFTATVAWTLYEVGFAPWPMLPRLGLFSALGCLFLLPGVRRKLGFDTPLLASRFFAGGAAVVLVLAALTVLMNRTWEVREATALGTGVAYDPSGTWSHYGASERGTRYSPHDQINLENADRLETAWTYRTRVPGPFQGTPIQIGDQLLLCTPKNVMIALDPDTGTERWRYDPKVVAPPFGFGKNCRGVTYHETPASQSCPARVFTSTTDARLIAVNAESGRPCADFGENGEVSLLPGMGDVKPGFYFTTSPGTIAGDSFVIGGWVADNQEIEEPSGVVRGFDVISGELNWAWDMGREERTLPPPGQTYTRGTPNVWSLTSADSELGLVYLPTGNATPDYYGGHRSEAMETYASSVVALDARTGEPRWHFQTTHHDIWDYDVPSQPTLVDIPIDGSVRKALIQATKRAELFVLDRVTGEPLTEVIEQIVPQTNVPMEYTTPTQPVSTGMPSFELKERAPLEEHDMWGITPYDHLACRNRFKKLRYEGALTPPSIGEGTLLYPGVGGGMNWGSVAVDEVNRLLVVNTLHMPTVVRLIPRDEVDEDTRFGIGGPQAGTPYAAYSMFFLSPIFAPCVRPPYGEMAVVDLASREILWRRPLGTARDMGPLGIASKLPLPMGMFYRAGSIVTGGGLIFIGGVLDSKMRAINVFTGEEVWSADLPAPAQATPMTYRSPNSDTQYVVVTVPDEGTEVPGHGEASGDTPAVDQSGGYVIAYRVAN